MTCLYAVYRRFTSEQNIYTAWKGRDGKNIPRKLIWKAVVAMLVSDKINFKTKAIKRNKGYYIIYNIILWILYNTQGNNPSGTYNSYKHICTQHRSTQISKENLEGFKKDIESNTLILTDFNTLLSPLDRSSKQSTRKYWP